MAIFKQIGDFFLSAWIWNLTFDWFHPVITGCVMFLIVRIIFRRGTLHSLFISFLAQAVTITILSIIAMGLSDYLQWRYDPVDAKVAIAMLNVFYASLSLAIIYTIVQLIYFAVGHFIWRYNLYAFLVMTVLSNTIGFVMSYMFIQMVRVWYYVA